MNRNEESIVRFAQLLVENGDDAQEYVVKNVSCACHPSKCVCLKYKKVYR